VSCARAARAATRPLITCGLVIWRWRSCRCGHSTGQITARVDGAGATHEFTRWCRDAVIAFSVGAKLTDDVLKAARLVCDEAWQQGIRKDGSENPDAFVCELTGRVNSRRGPSGAG
jgi:hypothetical protein